ncbi:MAG TPA: lysylphosphatidylglycerol synthase transmembrane domain-containing protein [Gaiellaceae bacterium]|nr:lysylphosphatidylglycerol synthase transmembrane domain-containing protein [Gaiellaceae bacterium]
MTAARATTLPRRARGWARRHRRPLLIGLAGAVLAVGTATLIGKAAGYTRLLDSLRGANLHWLPVLAGGQVLAYLGYILAYRATARVNGGPQLPFALTTWVVAASFGAYAVANAIGALGVDYWALRRTGAGHHGAFTRIIAFKTLEWAVLSSVVAVLAALVLAGVSPPVRTELALAWVAVVPVCFLAGRWVTSPRRVERLTRSQGVGRARRLVSDTISSVVIVRQILARPRAHLEAVGGAVLYWTGDILTLWAGLRAFDVHIDPIPLVVGYATGYVVTMLPLPFGGVGGVDAAMTYALTLVGVPLGPALLAVFAYRFFTFWLPFLPGLLAGATLPAAYDRLPTVPHPAAGRSP